MSLVRRWWVVLAIGFAGTVAGEERLRYAIAVHGGAGSAPGNFSVAANEARHLGIRKALEAGTKVLEEGGTSLDAVELVVRILEDDPQFNAGRGGVLNAEGFCELDSSIMDGKTKACGAVAGTTVAKHPISLARAVMEKTRHVLLGGAGADAFATETGAAIVGREYFVTDRQRARWEKQQKNLEGGGTVGCVALDARGNLAAGTSTGGLMNKRVGRIGDSPVVGAGTYADNATCAVSGTGVGEEFIRHAIAYDIGARMKYQGASLAEAVGANIDGTLAKGHGGVIAVDRYGNVVMKTNTGGMACGMADSTGRLEVRWPRGKVEN